MQAFLPRYLEMSMESFSRNQEEMREKLTDTFGGGAAIKNFENLARQNVAMFENTMRMFTPGVREAEPGPSGRANQWWAGQKAGAAREEEIRELKDQLEAMRRELAELASREIAVRYSSSCSMRPPVRCHVGLAEEIALEIIDAVIVEQLASASEPTHSATVSSRKFLARSTNVRTNS